MSQLTGTIDDFGMSTVSLAGGLANARTCAIAMSA